MPNLSADGGSLDSALTRWSTSALGQWPSEEQALDRIIAALMAIADATEDEDDRTKAQRFAAWLKTNASTVGVGVATAALTGQLPGQ